MTTLEYLEKHLPAAKAQSIINYLSACTCTLKITRQRKTKRGDFRQQGEKRSISVNHDVNSFRFLFTLMHELAHLETFMQHKNRVKPHGKEWKINFRKLYYAFHIDEEFSKDEQIERIVAEELKNPRACSGIDVGVERAFAAHDEEQGIYLEQLPEGAYFVFGIHHYQKIETRRTRVVCLNLSNNRKYTIHKAAKIEWVNAKRP